MLDYICSLPNSATVVATIQDDFLEVKVAHLVTNTLDGEGAGDIASDVWSLIVECGQADKPGNVGMQWDPCKAFRGAVSGVCESFEFPLAAVGARVKAI